jgi:hypothetical protein
MFCISCDFHYDAGPNGKYERGCQRGSRPCPEEEKQEKIYEAGWEDRRDFDLAIKKLTETNKGHVSGGDYLYRSWKPSEELLRHWRAMGEEITRSIRGIK